MAVNTPKKRQTPRHAAAAAQGTGDWETVNRVVFLTSDEDMTMPLYAIEWTRPKLDEDVVNPFADFYSLDFGAMNESELRRLLNGEQKAHRQCLGRRVHSDRSHGNHNPYRSACLVLHVFQCIPGKLLASLDASAIRALYRTGEGCRRIGAHAFHGTRSPAPRGDRSD